MDGGLHFLLGHIERLAERELQRDDGHTGRIARFTLQRLVAGHLLPARETTHHPYARNPALTD